MSRNPDWYYDMLDAAAEAHEHYSQEELEDYYEEWKETEEGKRWIELVSTFKWSIGNEKSDKQD